MSGKQVLSSAVISAIEALENRLRLYKSVYFIADLAVFIFLLAITVAVICRGDDVIVAICYITFSFAVFSRMVLCVYRWYLLSYLGQFISEQEIWQDQDEFKAFSERWQGHISRGKNLPRNELDSVFSFVLFTFLSIIVPKFAIVGTLLSISFTFVSFAFNETESNNHSDDQSRKDPVEDDSEDDWVNDWEWGEEEES